MPALCEIFHLPYTGSDAFAMVLTLDKHITMLYAESLGIHTPKGFLYQPQFHTLDGTGDSLRPGRDHISFGGEA